MGILQETAEKYHTCFEGKLQVRFRDDELGNYLAFVSFIGNKNYNKIKRKITY